MTSKIRESKLASASESWPKLVEEIMDLNEDELEELLNRERNRKPLRQQFVRRIHQRLGRVRTARERREMLKGSRS